MGEQLLCTAPPGPVGVIFLRRRRDVLNILLWKFSVVASSDHLITGEHFN
jgi:hypothetical protein